MDDGPAEEIRAADCASLGQGVDSRSRGAGNAKYVVIQIEGRRVHQVLHQIPAKYRMLGALLVIEPADRHVAGFSVRVPINDRAASVRCLR